ncbi:TetR/AcrR family transcriptional regulator [Parapedomonas caeni]
MSLEISDMPARTMATARKRGRPLDAAKRAAILEAAGQLFLAQGYEGTSMDAVAAAAGVSKLTVYKRFAGKEALFAQVIRAKCDRMMDPFAIEQVQAADPRAGMMVVGRLFLDLILDPQAIAAHRLVLIEGPREPRLAQLFFENAVEQTVAKTAAFLDRHRQAGRLRFADAREAAAQFICLLKGNPHMVVMLGLRPLAEGELEAHIATCVDLLLAAWRPETATAQPAAR